MGKGLLRHMLIAKVQISMRISAVYNIQYPLICKRCKRATQARSACANAHTVLGLRCPYNAQEPFSCVAYRMFVGLLLDFAKYYFLSKVRFCHSGIKNMNSLLQILTISGGLPKPITCTLYLGKIKKKMSSTKNFTRHAKR